jgi:hypothetical protein
MNLNAPRQITFLVSLFVAILALVGWLVPGLPVLSQITPMWTAIIAYAILAAGCILPGL